MPPADHFFCYLLRSLNPRSPGTTYVGFTTHPTRRIRQHNGDITAGARRTSKKRPWEMVAVVTGFPSKVAALQFEWAWQHPRESRAIRDAVAAAGLLSKRGAPAKLAVMALMLQTPPFVHWPLGLHLLSSDIRDMLTRAMKPAKGMGSSELPAQVACALSVGPIEALAVYQGVAKKKRRRPGAASAVSAEPAGEGLAANADASAGEGSSAEEVGAAARAAKKRKRVGGGAAREEVPPGASDGQSRHGTRNLTAGSSAAAMAVAVAGSHHSDSDDDGERHVTDSSTLLPTHDVIDISDGNESGIGESQCSSIQFDSDDECVDVLLDDDSDGGGRVEEDIDAGAQLAAAAPSVLSAAASCSSSSCVPAPALPCFLCKLELAALAAPGGVHTLLVDTPGGALPPLSQRHRPYFECGCGLRAHVTCLARHHAHTREAAAGRVLTADDAGDASASSSSSSSSFGVPGVKQQPSLLFPPSSFSCPGASSGCTARLMWPLVVRQSRARLLSMGTS